MSNESIKCPKCGFDGWKYLKLIHEEGSSNSSSVVAGGGTSGIGGGIIQGSSNTVLAQRAAPPDLPFIGIGGVVIGIAATIYGFYGHYFLIALGLVVIAASSLIAWKEITAYNVAKAWWDRGVACMRCGEFFSV